VLYDETGECIIIDPGCYDRDEREELAQFITAKNLVPVKIVLTHSHIDHVFGNKFVHGKYGVPIYAHTLAPRGLSVMERVAEVYGMRAELSPDIDVLMDEGYTLRFGNTELQLFHCPGHSPDSLAFYHAPSGIVIAGDVLFYRSIGRTDLPGGDYGTLIRSIREKLFLLPDETVVYSGHGPETTIGDEKKLNPFVN
jgi:glyoxylase-like metal-dependent hydrolase (beta-lactamase superfamily II)